MAWDRKKRRRKLWKLERARPVPFRLSPAVKAEIDGLLAELEAIRCRKPGC